MSRKQPTPPPYKQGDTVIRPAAPPGPPPSRTECNEGMALFDELVADAKARAAKASAKFPQPNYVLTKFAEESGEVVKECVHYAEGRGNWDFVKYEMTDVLAMMIRLLVEGDQVHGFIPPHIKGEEDAKQ